jgi:hypothetical protein
VDDVGQNISFDVIARDRASSTFSKISKSSSTAESSLSKFGKKAAVALSGLAVGYKAVSFLKDSVKAASDLNETTNKSAVIFGKNQKAIVGWAKTSDTALGLSKQAAMDAASSYGDMFLQLGIGRDRATKMSTGVVQLAADLGSFNNLGTDDVLERIAGGFRGEYDALQKVIPNISAARVQQEALRQTHKKSVTDLTAAEKASATLAIIQKDGARAAGDFAKTSDGLANSQKIQAAKVENLKAKIGTGLLPVQLAYTKFMSDKAVPAVSKFVSGMQDGTGAGGKFAGVVKDLASAAKSAVSFLNGLPDPVKKFGIQGLIAYGVIRKLTSATSGWGTSMTGGIAKVKQFGAEMTYSTTRTAALRGGLQAASGMLRNVAGAGGMLLLADSAGRAGTKLGVLESAAGGALSGAALGAFAGPAGAGVGAAIGGLAGAALSLSRNTKGAGDAASTAIGKWQTYAATLDQVSGATTEATRAAALKSAADAGLLKTTRSLGLEDRQVVNALVNGGKARAQVIAAVKGEVAAVDSSIAAKERELAANQRIANDMSVPLATQTAAANRAKSNIQEIESLKDLRDARKKDLNAVLDGVGAVRKGILETQKNAAAVRDLSGKLKGIPAAKATRIKAEGIIPTLRGIVDLSQRYRLTPKQVRTVIAASGVPFTQKQIDRLVATVVNYNKLHPKPKIDADTSAAAAKIQAIINGIARIRDKTVRITTVTNATVGEHAGTRGKGGKGAPRIAGDRGSSAERVMGDSMRATATQTMTIKRALAKFGNALSKVTDSLASRKDLRQSFLDTFKADSIFGVDLSEGGGVGKLIDFQAKQAAQASQLLADIQNVASRGLSKDLIAQLQSQGTSGALQLRAIAMGSDGQIGQLNALNAQTSSSLSAAGMLAGNTVRGGSIDADIKAAERQEKMLDRLVKKLEDLQDGKYLIVEIEGEQIVKAIKKRNKRKGVSTAGV